MRILKSLKTKITPEDILEYVHSWEAKNKPVNFELFKQYRLVLARFSHLLDAVNKENIRLTEIAKSYDSVQRFVRETLYHAALNYGEFGNQFDSEIDNLIEIANTEMLTNPDFLRIKHLPPNIVIPYLVPENRFHSKHEASMKTTSNTKKGFVDNIEELTVANTNFREVLYTSKNLQLVVMSIEDEIGEETHDSVDQFFRIEEGYGLAIINGVETEITAGSAVIIPMGCKHNILNLGDEPLKVYTLYSPPNHKDGIIRETKEDAEANPEEYDGTTTE